MWVQARHVLRVCFHPSTLGLPASLKYSIVFIPALRGPGVSFPASDTFSVFSSAVSSSKAPKSADVRECGARESGGGDNILKSFQKAGSPPLRVVGKLTFKVAVLSGGRGVVRPKAHVSPDTPISCYLSTWEMFALELDILSSKRTTRLGAFSPPIILPMHLNASAVVPPASGVAVARTVSGICASLSFAGATVASGVALVLEPNAVSPVFFRIGSADVPLGEIVIEPDDPSFTPAAANGIMDNDIALGIANETDDPAFFAPSVLVSI